MYQKLGETYPQIPFYTLLYMVYQIRFTSNEVRQLIVNHLETGIPIKYERRFSFTNPGTGEHNAFSLDVDKVKKLMHMNDVNALLWIDWVGKNPRRAKTVLKSDLIVLPSREEFDKIVDSDLLEAAKKLEQEKRQRLMAHLPETVN